MKYTQAGKGQLFSGSGCIVCSKREKKQRQSSLAVAGNGVIEIRVFLATLLTQQLKRPPVQCCWHHIPCWDGPASLFFLFVLFPFATCLAPFHHNLNLPDPGIYMQGAGAA